jgi:crotonobetainyl-CoA:carnitine CoA-transferase CaiB-like acyl-CoA transferase
MNHLALAGVGARHDEFSCRIGWRLSTGEVGEEAVQAESGLVDVHSRDLPEPRRLGIDVAGVAAGIVAAQGVLAGLIARRRGLEFREVTTSALQAALVYVRHHLAIATCGGRFPPVVEETAPGPPFRTADGEWVEIEVLSGQDWISFWQKLGVDRADFVGRSWLPFVYRYLAGHCALSAELHTATRRYTVEQLRGIASACGVALCRVRGHRMAFERPPWTITDFPAPGRDERPPRDGTAPLSGLRVIEAGTRLQGPLAGLLLGQLGAEVIKVEPPGGDFGRISPPLAGSTGAAYLAYNRGKHVVEVDYKCAGGRTELVELIAGADVFLHNWRPGRAESLGLDATALARANPGLVHAWSSGWGDAEDPPSEIAGDFLVQAHAGCGALLHPPGEPPVPSRVTLVDTTAGLLVCEGVLAGLYRRERTGLGCRVDTSLLAAATLLTTHPGATGSVSRAPSRVADLPGDPRLAGLLERLPEGCWVPAPPWRFTSPAGGTP